MEGLFTAWTGSQYTKGLHRCLYCFLEKKKPRRGWPSRDWRERRNAIRLTTEHTVETLVVADADMVQYHGAEAAQRFILTVMNMVSPGPAPDQGFCFLLDKHSACGCWPSSPGAEGWGHTQPCDPWATWSAGGWEVPPGRGLTHQPGLVWGQRLSLLSDGSLSALLTRGLPRPFLWVNAPPRGFNAKSVPDLRSQQSHRRNQDQTLI